MRIRAVAGIVGGLLLLLSITAHAFLTWQRIYCVIEAMQKSDFKLLLEANRVAFAQHWSSDKAAMQRR